MMRRSPRLRWTLCLLACLSSSFVATPLFGQADLFDEPLVTGESETDIVADDTEFGDAPVDPQEQFNQMMTEAQALMDQEKWAQAVELYNRILTMGRHPRALLNQAICFYKLGANEQAINSASMAMISPQASLQPGLMEEAYLLRGELYMEISRYREAVDDFTQAAVSNPANADPHFMQGKSLLRLVVTSPGQGMDQSGQGSLLQAVKALEQAISLRADFGEAYLERGRALFRLRQMDYAIEDFQMAVSLLGPTSEASADLGVALGFRANQEAYAAAPDDQQIVEDLKSAIASMDQYLSAAQLGQKTPPWQTRDPLQTRPEKVLLSRGDTRVNLANELTGPERDQTYQAAISDAEELLTFDADADDEARAYYIRGSALRMTNDLQGAIGAFTSAIQIYETQGASFSDAYLRRGICYYYLDEFDLAQQDFQVAATGTANPYVPYEPRAMFWAGLVEAKLGNFENAIRSYTRSIAAAPRFSPAYLNRGLAYLNVGRFQQAVEDFDMILRQDGNDDQVQAYREFAIEQL